MLDAGLGDLAGQAAGDLGRLVDRSSFGDKAGHVGAGGDVDPVRGLDVQADQGLLHAASVWRVAGVGH